MITIQQAVEDIILKSPYLESALVDGLINTSALARKIKPEIENKVFKKIQFGAIAVAINRLSNSLKERQAITNPLLKSKGDITIKSNLTAFTFINSPLLISRQKELLEKINKEKRVFLTTTQSLYQTTIIISSSFKNVVKQLFSEENKISEIDSLSAITLTLSEETVKAPGVYYSVLKTLAWYEINIIEIVSSFNELTIILENKDIDQAFSVLKSLTDI